MPGPWSQEWSAVIGKGRTVATTVKKTTTDTGLAPGKQVQPKVTIPTTAVQPTTVQPSTVNQPEAPVVPPTTPVVPPKLSLWQRILKLLGL